MEDRSPVLKAARCIEICSLASEWPVEAQMTSSRSKYNDGQRTILCVDDEPLVLASWAELIASAGYRVLTARGGAEAIQQFSAETVHAVVLDYEMPGMNGGIVAARIRQISSEVPSSFILVDAPLALKNSDCSIALFPREQGSRQCWQPLRES
jgi:CheY-like chemotaxis protein